MALSKSTGIDVSPEQVAALKAAGMEVPNYAEEALEATPEQPTGGTTYLPTGRTVKGEEMSGPLGTKVTYDDNTSVIFPKADWEKYKAQQNLGLSEDTTGGSGVVGGANDVRGERDQLNDDITKGLESFGLEQPDDEVDGSVQEMLDMLQTRRESLEKRQAEDRASIEKQYTNAEGQLSEQQARELKQAEGRTRIGGFFTQMEADYILNMQKSHRLEQSVLRGQRSQALQTARRAYEDADYETAALQLQTAREIEATQYQRKQDYFSNVLRYQQMSTPLKDAGEAMQKKVTDWMGKYPDAFKDVTPVELSTMSFNEAYNRVLNSDTYKTELENPDVKDWETREVGGQTVRFGFDKTGKIVSKTVLGKSGSGGTGITELSSVNRTKLLGAGFSSAEIENIESDVNKYGLDSVLEGIDDEKQRGTLESIYGLEAETKLTRESVSSLFGISDDAARTGFKGFFGAGETNKEKLDAIMDTISKYQAVGYSDADIIKMMKSQ